MMNSGLPSLLDAIFGKPDLDSVSLEEMYELIKEFPSFNAGHFLLSKKLKLENPNSSYEKATMRTALYFNNPFWLQSVLNEENHPIAAYPQSGHSGENGSDHLIKATYTEESVSIISEFDSVEKSPEPEPSVHPDIADLQITHTEQFFKEELREYPLAVPDPAFDEKQSSAFEPVTSFDDLISKYHIQPMESIQETQTESENEINEPWAEETPQSGENRFAEENLPDPLVKTTEEKLDGKPKDIHPEGNSDSYEIREEVFNEYGIFEEVIVKRTDFDLEAFDRPVPPLATTPEEPAVSIQDEVPTGDEIPAETFSVSEISESTNETIVENPVPEDLGNIQAESDYDAFDRPLEIKANDEMQKESDAHMEMRTDLEKNPQFTAEDPRTDDTGEGDSFSEEGDHSLSGPMLGLAARFDEQQKARAPFDPKKAESIVFAPYHMIDYFASQGIKLVLEENPVDPFGKQLKSFTNWLKVMKKIPAQPLSEKTDEKEGDRIRHFAAHSIDEREILTESMAEVLAKQGMYENAIALYQKLSLIYPPKSAYFASRIEQLKASSP